MTIRLCLSRFTKLRGQSSMNHNILIRWRSFKQLIRLQVLSIRIIKNTMRVELISHFTELLAFTPVRRLVDKSSGERQQITWMYYYVVTYTNKNNSVLILRPLLQTGWPFTSMNIPPKLNLLNFTKHQWSACITMKVFLWVLVMILSLINTLKFAWKY